MSCFNIELNRLGNTPTPTIERVGATPTAEVDYLGGVPIATLIGLSDVPTAVLEHLGGMTVSGSLLCYVGTDTLTISEASLSFTNEEVGTMKFITVLATAHWSAELNDPDGLFEISPTAGLAGFVGRVTITLTKTNANIENYSASVVFKSRGLRQTLTLVAEASEATYTPLTYIEATGAQYINTGYVVQEDDVIEMDYIRTSSTSADKALFGASDGANGIWYSIYGTTAYYRFGHNASDNASGAGNRYRVKLQKGNVDVDGLTEALSFTALPDVPLYLFASNNNNESQWMYCHCKTRSFKITKQTGEVVMELLPHKRTADGKIGMLDSVSGNFFVNEGTGEDFIAGAEINATPEYELIDYVTFSKDRLYDLGIVKSTYTLEVMFKRSESTTTPYLYGCVTSPHTASVTAYLSSGGSWRFGSSYKGLSTNNTVINRTIISNGKTEFNFTSGTFTKATFTTPDTVVLGGYRAASGALTRNYQGRVYFFRITEGDTPIIDYYPCLRKSDGAEGFWDCVAQTFIESI